MSRPSDDDLKTLARLRREDHLKDLRDGRVRRPHRIESGKRYRRRPKFQKETQPDDL